MSQCAQGRVIRRADASRGHVVAGAGRARPDGGCVWNCRAGCLTTFAAGGIWMPAPGGRATAPVLSARPYLPPELTLRHTKKHSAEPPAGPETRASVTGSGAGTRASARPSGAMSPVPTGGRVGRDNDRFSEDLQMNFNLLSKGWNVPGVTIDRPEVRAGPRAPVPCGGHPRRRARAFSAWRSNRSASSRGRARAGGVIISRPNRARQGSSSISVPNRACRHFTAAA